MSLAITYHSKSPMSSGVCRLFHLKIFAKKPGKILVKNIDDFVARNHLVMAVSGQVLPRRAVYKSIPHYIVGYEFWALYLNLYILGDETRFAQTVVPQEEYKDSSTKLQNSITRDKARNRFIYCPPR